MSYKKTMLFLTIAGSLLVTDFTLAQGQSEGFVIEEIVVTARKREESLQEIPLSIAAFTANELTQRQIQTSDQLSDAIANLSIDAVAPSSAQNGTATVFIRGIGQTDFTPVTDPGVGIYVDGVYMARTVGAAFDLINVERVEVLRGPQGTLFGRNTMGGAVSVFTERPDSEFGGSAEVQVGDDDKLYFTGDVNVPFSDNFFGKFVATRRSRDGYVQRVQNADRVLSGVPFPTDGADLGDEDMWGARASFIWEASDKLNFYLAADWARMDENGAPLTSGGLNDQQIFPFLGNLIDAAGNCTLIGAH